MLEHPIRKRRYYIPKTETLKDNMKLIIFLVSLIFVINALPPNYNLVPNNIFDILIPGGAALISSTGLNVLHTTRLVGYGALAMFDAWTKCNETATSPITGSVGKRSDPYNPTVCNGQNKSVTAYYSFYRFVTNAEPYLTEPLTGLMFSLGMDPFEFSTNTATDYGLGNYIGFKMQNFSLYDGLNQNGSLSLSNTFQTYNKVTYGDYTGHQPINTAYEFKNKNRWQPLFERNVSTQDDIVQQYLLPQARWAWNPAVDSITDFVTNFPEIYANYGLGFFRRRAWIEQNEDILNKSANLNDYTKMESELFENKLNLVLQAYLNVINTTPGLISHQTPWTIDDISTYLPVIDLAGYAGGLAAWAVKYYVDSQRPVSAIRNYYANTNVTAWGGPYQGTVSMKGSEWRSYLRTMNHPEYPSGTTCFCKAYADANVAYFKNNTLLVPINVFVLKGSSNIEKGLTPQTNLTLGPYTTWSSYAEGCGFSRGNAGVHFDAAITSALDHCGFLGTNVFNLIQGYINGTNTKILDPANRDVYPGRGNDPLEN